MSRAYDKKFLIIKHQALFVREGKLFLKLLHPGTLKSNQHSYVIYITLITLEHKLKDINIDNNIPTILGSLCRKLSLYDVSTV